MTDPTEELDMIAVRRTNKVLTLMQLGWPLGDICHIIVRALALGDARAGVPGLLSHGYLLAGEGP